MYSMERKKRSFRFRKAPDIETRVVMIREARNSAGRDIDLKKGVSFMMSYIITRNIMKIERRTRVSLTEISVETFFRFRPKNVPIRSCQTGDIVIVSFQGFVGGGVASIAFPNSSTGIIGCSVSAEVVGRIVRISSKVIIPLFILLGTYSDLYNLGFETRKFSYGLPGLRRFFM